MPITGDGGNNLLVGGAGDDEILGLGGSDVLIGSGGKDTLDGGTGADTMDGGAGDDTYVVDNYDDEVVEYANKGEDTIKSSITYSLNFAEHVENLTLTGSADIDGYGDELDNNLLGNSGDNDLWGLAGNDILKGGGGDDALLGGAGDDIMHGGTGDDYYEVDSEEDTVTEYFNQGIDKVSSSVDFELGANVEKLVLTGTGNLVGIGNELNNEITGNSGNNWLYGGIGADTMKGGAGNDKYYVDQSGDVVVENANSGIDTVEAHMSYSLKANFEHLYLNGTGNFVGAGNELDNSIVGNAGNNVLFGGDGKDSMSGGPGTDTMYGGKGNDTFSINDNSDDVIEYAGEGTDWVATYGDVDYVLTANVENLWLDLMGDFNDGTGNDLANIIYGSLSNNVLDGGLNADTLYGNSGDDTFLVDNTLDLAIEYANDGNDVVFAKADYTLGANIETLSLAGGNAVSGTGNTQSNTIFGNAGDNILDGGGGTDALSGLGGNDTFVFKAGEAHGDVVYEFEGNGAGAGDILKFVGYGPGATLTQFSADVWVIASADGSIQEGITLVGAPSLVGQDCVFV